jgi:hypothetical protein
MYRAALFVNISLSVLLSASNFIPDGDCVPLVCYTPVSFSKLSVAGGVGVVNLSPVARYVLQARRESNPQSPVVAFSKKTIGQFHRCAHAGCLHALPANDELPENKKPNAVKLREKPAFRHVG